MKQKWNIEYQLTNMAHSSSIIKDISHLGVRLGLGLPGWLLGPVARAHTMPGMRRDEEVRSYQKAE